MSKISFWLKNKQISQQQKAEDKNSKYKKLLFVHLYCMCAETKSLVEILCCCKLTNFSVEIKSPGLI